MLLTSLLACFARLFGDCNICITKSFGICTSWEMIQWLRIPHFSDELVAIRKGGGTDILTLYGGPRLKNKLLTETARMWIGFSLFL